LNRAGEIARVISYTSLVELQLDGNDLIAGDQIIMTYSTDMPAVAGTIYWRFRTDRDHDNVFEPDDVGGCYVGPGFVLQGEAASYIQLTAPGDVVLGEPFTVAAVAFDQYANLAAPGSAGVVALRSTAPAECVSGLPETFDFAAGGGVSSAEFTVTYTGPVAAGFQRIFDADTNGPPVFTHFSRVHAVAPVYRRFFGDTHFHTGSGDKNAWKAVSCVSCRTCPSQPFPMCGPICCGRVTSVFGIMNGLAGQSNRREGRYTS
jgi:hypothetical protein